MSDLEIIGAEGRDAEKMPLLQMIILGLRPSNKPQKSSPNYRVPTVLEFLAIYVIRRFLWHC